MSRKIATARHDGAKTPRIREGSASASLTRANPQPPAPTAVGEAPASEGGGSVSTYGVTEVHAPQATKFNEAERFKQQQKDAGADSSEVRAQREKAVHRMMTEVKKFFPKALRSTASREALRGLMLRSFARADQASTEEDARTWANGFRMPGELADKTSERLAQAGGDFDAMVSSMRAGIDGGRLSRASIAKALSADNPEIPLLQELAEGMITLVDTEDYTPTPHDDLPKVRGGFKRVGTAVERLIYENFVAKDLAFVARLADVPKGALIHPPGWAPKAGKAKGRNTGDPGDTGGGTALNSADLRDQYEEKWGAINNPTVDRFDWMISTVLTDHVPPGHVLSNDGSHPDDPVLLVQDLKAAYTLLSFRAAHVKFMATLISAGLVVFFLCGIFGWTGTPFAFNVVTRAIVWELERQVRGLAEMYVDDIATCCLRKHLAFNIDTITGICTTLMGATAIETDKTCIADGAEGRGWKTTIIGFDWDVSTRLITISPRNVEKTFYGYMGVDTEQPVTREHMERLASWASRYAAICRALSPFIAPLYGAYTWMANRNASALIELGPKARRAVRMIKLLLILTSIDAEHFARPFLCDIESHIRFIIEFDASLTGVGFIVFAIDPATGAETPVGLAGISIGQLGFRGVSDNQNLSEFVAAALGIRAVIALGGRDCGIAVRGDSTTALTWVGRERFKGKLVNHAAIAYVLQAIAWDVKVEKVTHIPERENKAADYLSRLGEKGRTIEAFWREFPQFKSVPQVDAKANNFIPLCDPNIDIDSDEAFVDFWLRAQAVIGGRAIGSSGKSSCKTDMT